jgi:hypothetical protein
MPQLRALILGLPLVMTATPASSQVWQDLGPGRIPNWRDGSSGRVSAVAAHPTNAGIYYLGGADGGVWKTTNDGGLWTPLTDGMPTNSIGCITIDPTNANRLYVGTGEVNRNEHTRYGLGVYRSDDGGTTWAHLPRSGGVHTPQTFDGRCIGRICVNPSNANKVFAAVSKSVGDRNGKRHQYGENPRGLYASSDAGETWTHVDLPNTTGDWGCTDVVHVSGGLVFLAGVWDDTNSPYTTARIYRTSDGGVSWAQVGSTFSQRIALAVATGGMVVWALDATASQHRLWRSADGGQVWDPAPFLTRNTANGIHMMVLAVNPSDANKVYFGGQYNGDLDDGLDDLRRVVYPNAQSVTDIGPSHEDLRSIGWRCDGLLMVGNDGGLEISINNDPTLPGDSEDPISPGHWLDRNHKSLGITQVIPGISTHPTEERLIFAGTQDNGSLRRITLDPLTTREWEHTVAGGDGGAHVTDTYGAAPHSRVIQWPFLGTTVTYSDDGGDSWTYTFPPPDPGVTRKYAQIAVDATFPDPGNGPNPIFVARNPLTIALWSAGYTYGYLAAVDEDFTLRGLAVGPHQGVNQRLYATYNDYDNLSPTNPSFIAVSHDGGLTFDPSKPTTPSSTYQHWNYGTRDVALDPQSPDVAFCVSSRWRTATVPSRVFFTTNAGTTWTGRDGTLTTSKITAAPANAVAVVRLGPSQRRILVGTDQGVWISINDGLSWGKYGTGLPNSSVTDVVYDTPRGKIFIATLGRGIWSVDYSAAVSDVDNGSGDGVPDGTVDESDWTAFMKWMAESDLDSKDIEKQDQRADADGDGLVTVEDGLLFMAAYDGKW